MDGKLGEAVLLTSDAIRAHVDRLLEPRSSARMEYIPFTSSPGDKLDGLGAVFTGLSSEVRPGTGRHGDEVRMYLVRAGGGAPDASLPLLTIEGARRDVLRVTLGLIAEQRVRDVFTYLGPSAGGASAIPIDVPSEGLDRNLREISRQISDERKRTRVMDLVGIGASRLIDRLLLDE
jgi:hypothetical protein